MIVGAALSPPTPAGCDPGVEFCEACLPALNPWHPTMKVRASMTANAFQRVGEWLIWDQITAFYLGLQNWDQV